MRLAPRKSPIWGTVDRRGLVETRLAGTVAEAAEMGDATQTLLERAPAPVAQPPLAEPKRKPVTAKPEMNRQERVTFTAYLVMIALIVAFLVVAGLVAWLA